MHHLLVSSIVKAFSAKTVSSRDPLNLIANLTDTESQNSLSLSLHKLTLTASKSFLYINVQIFIQLLTPNFFNISSLPDLFF
mmetsp:Transcript_22740/g.51261  ORF Transcript_22740/g.51261 Transcript_22740/m.51261 type:complete len:82 (+) Transcript_22740:243-488(+)